MANGADAPRDAISDEPVCGFRVLNPHHPNGRTIVMTHGAWHTYTGYLETFDHRPGWAYDFVAAGYRVVLCDYPGTGSSPQVADPTVISTEYIISGFTRLIEQVVGGPVDFLVHSMSGPLGIGLVDRHPELVDHLVAIAPAQPADLSEPPAGVEDVGDAIRIVYSDREWTVPKYGWTSGDEAFVRHCIGPGWRFPEVDVQEYLATLSPLWAGLSLERAWPIIDPSRPALLPVGDLTGAKVLVVTGTHDTNHPRPFDQRLVDWLGDKGAEAAFLHLGDRGIEGNGHMMMLEENSSAIAGLLIDWLDD